MVPLFPHRDFPNALMALAPFAIAAIVACGARAQDAIPPVPDSKPEPKEEVAPAPDPGAAPEPVEKESLTREEFDALIGKLSSDDFATRELAEQRLGKGVTVELAEVARQHFLGTPDPEVHFRLRRVLRDIVEADYFGRKKAFLGIQMQDDFVIGGKTGRETLLVVLVSQLIAPSAAGDQGIEVGDKILEVDGKGFEISPSLEFKAMIGAKASGEKVKFKIQSGGITSEKTIILGEMPPEIARLTAESPLAFDSFFQSWLLRGGAMKRP